MDVSHYTSTDRVVFLKSTEKHNALRELTSAACRSIGFEDEELVARLVFRREDQVSTRVSEAIALPHARLPDIEDTVATVGISREGIAYDGGTVHVIVLMLWAHTTNLTVLADLASLLRRPNLYEGLIAGSSAEEIIELLCNPPAHVERHTKQTAAAAQVVVHAIRLAAALRADAILFYPDAMGSLDFLSRHIPEEIIAARSAYQGRVLLLANQVSRYNENELVDEFIELPVQAASNSSINSTALLFLVSRGLLNRREKIMSVFGEPASGSLDSIHFTDLEREFSSFFRIPEGGLGDDVENLVFTRVLQLALELAQEGREGKPAGAIFVVGDYHLVHDHCRQLLINPFRGIPEDERNVLDPSLEETIKEFSRIDGAFIIRGNGVIESAGTYLGADSAVSNLTPGLGARHAAAAAITAVSDAVSLAISESTKRISIFRGGQRVMVV
ncbi:MAG: diadenylate cyclase [Spirochaetales bacterium]